MAEVESELLVAAAAVTDSIPSLWAVVIRKLPVGCKLLWTPVFRLSLVELGGDGRVKGSDDANESPVAAGDAEGPMGVTDPEETGFKVAATVA